MSWLILGLVLFLGTHSVRIVADGWRSQTVARIGEKAWKGAYALISVLGFGLIIWGFGQARLDPVVLWVPPVAMRHIAALLMLIAFIMMAAVYVPGNAIKAKLKHPMILSVKVWAFAHLLANGKLADVVLFGAFMLWAVLCFRSARQRDRAAGIASPSSSTAMGTVLTVLVGAVLYAAFAFWAHKYLIGVSPMGF